MTIPDGAIPLGPPVAVVLDGCGIEPAAGRTRRLPFEPVFRAADRLAPGEALRLSVDHDPEPLLEALDAARPYQFRWEPHLEGPAHWTGLLRRLRPDDDPAPVRRLSPRLARRVTAVAARARLERELRSIALDLLGPADPARLPAATRAWVDAATEEAIGAVRDLSLATLVERLDAVVATAPPDVMTRLDEAADRVAAGLA
jgi:uncharacterized protein (DUF2249 family)